MARTIAKLFPNSADFDSAGAFPQLLDVGTDPKRRVLAFDAATVEAAYWTELALVGLTGTMQALISYWMASAASGKVDFEVSIEKVTPVASFDMEGAASFDSVNAGDQTVPGTQGFPGQLVITLTNKDSLAAGDYYRVKVERDADDGTDDTAAGDCYIYLIEIQDSV